jgi:hypothetical protein
VSPKQLTLTISRTPQCLQRSIAPVLEYLGFEQPIAGPLFMDLYEFALGCLEVERR